MAAIDPTLQYQTPRTIGSMVGEGDPGASALLSRRSAVSAGELVPTTSYDKFNSALMQMLLKYQQMGTGQMQLGEEQLIQQQAGRIAAPATPGMPPLLQSQIRSAETEALQPSISGAKQLRQTFTEQLNSYGSLLDRLFTASEKAAAAEEKKREAPKTMETDQGIFQWNPDTMQWETTGLKKAIGELTIPEKLSQAVSSMAIKLFARRGTDGYISPEDYKTARYRWTMEGFSPKDFDDNFKFLINPIDPEDYGILD